MASAEYDGVSCVSDSCSFKKQSSGRSDYGFHGYMEICQFVYCLLSRSRKLGSLPSLNSWEDYMDLQKLDGFENVASCDFLHNHDFGAVLRSHKGGEFRVFQDLCPKFIDRLVIAILGQQPVTGELPQGVYCFCPELLLEGDDQHMLVLFQTLIRVLERSGVVSSRESKAAVEEYSTFVVDARSRHANSGVSAESIGDVRHYLLSDYCFLARKSLCRVFKLCCLAVLRPRIDFPAVEIDLSDCAVPSHVIASCVQGVQSCVVSSEFRLKSFFTQFTMNEVRKAIATASTFMSSGGFDPWDGLCGVNQSAFVNRYRRLFDERVSRKRSLSDGQPCGESGGDCEGSSLIESPAASVISAPPVPSSSGSSSFRFSKTKVYGSVASLLGREKGAVDPDAVDVKKSKKKSKQSAGKGATSGSKKK